ncbi:DUF3072 domain-containing protein [Azospirillum brasilense]|uniref:DUF3072 domain-containing protein n=1 Tax=Azospirillum brasilense TaxID=192 RepID=A0A235H6D3_AZOBR|nr:DUF3072 domain-containing protein [Azospirillum brasilense]OYD80755.1 DUF3072 domain-containing protein [Azospirillum brasilense]
MNTKRDSNRENRKQPQPHHGDAPNPTSNPKTAAVGGADHSNREKDPDDWTTGDEPMTGAQASYLKTLSEEAGESFDGDLTKAEASKRIDALQDKTGRGA